MLQQSEYHSGWILLMFPQLSLRPFGEIYWHLLVKERIANKELYLFPFTVFVKSKCLLLANENTAAVDVRQI